MDEQISIRSAKTSDCSQIVTFLKDEGTFKLAWASEKNLISIIKQDSNLIQIAIEDEKIVGFIILTPHGVNQYFFYRFIIKNSLRGKGVGSKLLLASENVVRKLGGNKIALYVEEGDKKVKGFYEKRGYIDDGNIYKSYYKELK